METADPVTITSFSVSGEVLGSGAASLYLIDKDGNKKKVFSNSQKGMRLITGFYGEESTPVNIVKAKPGILNIKEGSDVRDSDFVTNAMPGEFSGACGDACELSTDSGSFELIAYVEPGTKLIIEEFDYTTVEK
ncbi:hypothetical protein GF358_03415 [Candidatus Woesearchaeota archaeon]|nr:hypothetical protein [Candidatus Woesearchaeota archaeon]